MRILIHVPWGLQNGFVGGAERFVLDLAKGLKEKVNDAFIVCSNLKKETRVEGIQVLGRVPAEYKDKINLYGYANENFFKNEIIGAKFSEESTLRFSV